MVWMVTDEYGYNHHDTKLYLSKESAVEACKRVVREYLEQRGDTRGDLEIQIEEMASNGGGFVTYGYADDCHINLEELDIYS